MRVWARVLPESAVAPPEAGDRGVSLASAVALLHAMFSDVNAFALSDASIQASICLYIMYLFLT